MSNVLNSRLQYRYDTKENWESKHPQKSLKGEIYIFETTDGCGMKIGDGATNICDLEYTIEPSSEMIIREVPYLAETITYTGETIYPTFIGYDANSLIATGDISGKNAGTYTAVFTPRDGYVWFDGTKDAKDITWVINKAETVITATPDSVTAYNEFETIVSIATNSDSTDITVTVFEDAIAFEVLSSNSIRFYHDTSYNFTSSETSLRITVGATTNYLEGSITIPVKIIRNLDSYTWEEISQISASGNASSYFSIGDRKKIVLNGTVGTLTLNNYETYVYIIGFDHTNGTAGTDTGIHFGTFKDADGKDVALVDSKYDSEAYVSNYFNMSHWGAVNYDGWRGCDLRYDVLGSTDVAPNEYGLPPKYATRIGYNATSKCAENPVADTLMSAIPEDLRSVLKPMTKFTQSKSSMNTPTIDYLPLLADFEVFGTITNSNVDEQNYQTQYSYFASGNSKKKYKHSYLDFPSYQQSAYWWLRSAYAAYDNDREGFCMVAIDGASLGDTANMSLGLAPIFKV